MLALAGKISRPVGRAAFGLDIADEMYGPARTLGAIQASIGATLDDTLDTWLDILGQLATEFTRRYEDDGYVFLAEFRTHKTLEERFETVRESLVAAVQEGFLAWYRGEAFGDPEAEVENMRRDLQDAFLDGYGERGQQDPEQRNRTRRFAEAMRTIHDEDAIQRLTDDLALSLREFVLHPVEVLRRAAVPENESYVEEMAARFEQALDPFLADFRQDMTAH